MIARFLRKTGLTLNRADREVAEIQRIPQAATSHRMLQKTTAERDSIYNDLENYRLD